MIEYGSEGVTVLGCEGARECEGLSQCVSE